MSREVQIHAVDPARLASGQWCHRANKTLGEGDIAASYSADRIGMGQPVRKPFTWQGALWVCTGVTYRDGMSSHEAYRLVHPSVFEGEPVTYGGRTRNGGEARADGKGFYHGMIVKHGGKPFILSGPAVSFVPGQTEQLALF